MDEVKEDKEQDDQYEKMDTVKPGRTASWLCSPDRCPKSIIFDFHGLNPPTRRSPSTLKALRDGVVVEVWGRS